MNKLLRRIFPYAIGLLCLVSCRDKETETEHHDPVHQELVISLEPGMWTYYSISQEKVVGQSVIGNGADDSKWSERLDWDLAFSEYGIRTNSLTSGHGHAGMAVIPDSLYDGADYDFLESMEYVQDTLDVKIAIPLKE